MLPKLLDGLHFDFEEDGKPVTYVFSISHDEGAAVKSVTVNGQEVTFKRQGNPYRAGGAMIKQSDFHALLDREANVVSVNVS